MEDYIKRQINMIGQMLLLLARKLRLTDGSDTVVSTQAIQNEIEKNGFNLDVLQILSKEDPLTYMVETLQFSDEAVETFTNIILHSDASDEAKRNILEKSVSYLDSKGYFSFSLHSENITCS